MAQPVVQPDPPEASDATKVERFFAHLPQGLVDALPTGVCVTFELSDGDWRRAWTVRREEDGQGHIIPRPLEGCDCRLGCGASDFIGLITGSIDPRKGFIEGRFDVEGDVGLVLQLHRCL